MGSVGYRLVCIGFDQVRVSGVEPEQKAHILRLLGGTNLDTFDVVQGRLRRDSALVMLRSASSRPIELTFAPVSGAQSDYSVSCDVYVVWYCVAQ